MNFLDELFRFLNSPLGQALGQQSISQLIRLVHDTAFPAPKAGLAGDAQKG